ncbi:sugar ABC transporter substrate-binding protein [Streptomyces sp. V1I1]|uniref:sugar ABC transporter substrate-binding protein n=1 Tax=Streptomyces sp. V1I1 TaxID=3042272 RepID=UPI0027802000|nr:sugar ABC transporter substrate-binding protein [Streptomyces sp. V1I1]MDQ0938759.1 ABC-type glycerol-3-phosphate transport system substrate-binding protein [Streptomyces sp. V1I1]
MHRTTKVAVGVNALLALFTITACGGDSGGAGAKADAKQTLTVWAMGTEGQKLADVAKAYEKQHPNITIKVTPIGWDTVHQKLVAAAAAGTLPDMAQMGSTFMGEFAGMGVLEPVDETTFRKDDFFPAAWNGNVVDGKTYGVPWYVDTRALYYRTDLAQQAGVTEAPSTWSDLQSLALGYQSTAKTKWGISLQPSGLDTWQNWLPFLYSAGGDLVKNGKPTLDTPESVRSLTEYRTYFDKGLAKKSVAPGYDVVKDFGNGSVPMFFSGPWQITNISTQFPALKGKWKAVAVPGDKTSASFAGGSSLVTFNKSPHKAAATEFQKYLTSARQQADWFTRTSDLPANKAAWQQAPLASDAGLKVFGNQMATAKAVPPLAKWAEFGAQLDSAIESVTQGKASPAEAAKKMQSATEGLVG